MWVWLQSLQGGAATFIGSLAGSLIGLCAILVGALFHAHINRRRDDRLRKEDASAVAAALRAELTGIRRILEGNASDLKEINESFIMPDVAQSIKIMPVLLSKLGYFDIYTVEALMVAYIVVDQYCESLILAGGRMEEVFPGGRHLITMPEGRGKLVAEVHQGMIRHLEDAVGKLDKYLH